jgi:hypothetical protein
MLHNRLSSGAGTIGQLVADVPVGLSLTPPPRNAKMNYVMWENSRTVAEEGKLWEIGTYDWRRETLRWQDAVAWNMGSGFDVMTPVVTKSFLSSGLKRRVVRWNSADVLEEHITSIFKDEE